jgi:UMF1 family MFS transporter
LLGQIGRMIRVRRNPVLAWALYDWANSAFATTVMAGFFPVFFKQYWASGRDVADSTFLLGSANSAASLLIVISAPILGAIADRGGAKKRFLGFFAFIGVTMTAGLFLIAEGQWALALALYIAAVLGFSGGNIFYDALLVDVAREQALDRVSALGFGLGYIGGGLLFTINVLMTLSPQSFGLGDTGAAVRVSFLCVAVWWAVFSIPVMLWVEERPGPPGGGWAAAVVGGFRQLRSTFLHLRQLRVTFLFLIAYWLYIDGVDTIVRMAVDYGLSLGFDSGGLMLALLITQFVGFPAALVFGRIGERRGPKQGIMIAIFVYLLVVLWAYRIDEVWQFYVLAVSIGLVQGGIQALSRSLYARLIPREKAAEFFGFYNMLGKFAAVLGPFLMGWVGVLTGSSRAAILSLVVLFIAGALLLALVDERAGQDAARRVEATGASSD